MGRRDYEEANKLFTNIIIQAIGMALIVSVLFFIFAEPFVGVCGAKMGTETFRYAVIYLKIVTCGPGFNMLTRARGDNQNRGSGKVLNVCKYRWCVL